MKTKMMKKMGMGGMHTMPDGTMMPDSAMMPPMKKGVAKKSVKKPIKKAKYGMSMKGKKSC